MTKQPQCVNQTHREIIQAIGHGKQDYVTPEFHKASARDVIDSPDSQLYVSCAGTDKDYPTPCTT